MTIDNNHALINSSWWLISRVAVLLKPEPFESIQEPLEIAMLLDYRLDQGQVEDGWVEFGRDFVL